MSQTPVVFNTLPTCGLLGVVFVTLKLCKVIEWPWWAVLAPFWGPIALFLFLLLVAALCFVVSGVCTGFINKIKRR